MWAWRLRRWFGRLPFTACLLAAAALAGLVAVAPAVAPPGPPHGLLGLFAHDATVRRTALGSAVGLVATAFAFFRPPRWPRDLGRPPGPPTDMAGA